jgi:gamma-glutamyltranspeptidase / glutathione hydrolase
LSEETGRAQASTDENGIQRWPDWIWTAGAVCAILADRRRGVLEAGADPRRAAYAIGW